MGVRVLQGFVVVDDIKTRNGARKPELGRLPPLRIFSRRSWQLVNIVPITRAMGNPTSYKFKHLLCRALGELDWGSSSEEGV